ncbi:transposase [Bradyrhizobium sp. 160]|uniref:transposase n=1 Tax=Bradyrhizobium sp. 160 TaxID=2782634 RepID=UPI002097BEB4|nr:transposase [Bradyrhizobium sp. 160]
MFRSGREFAAWLGLTPKQNSTGGKDRLGRITKQGDSYLRHLLVIGARNVNTEQSMVRPWCSSLMSSHATTEDGSCSCA